MNPEAPAIFSHLRPCEAKQGDIVISSCTDDDNLYFIIKGQFEVIIEGCRRQVSSLYADELFIGKTPLPDIGGCNATVRAAADSAFIKISRQDFIKAIKAKPHYALLFAKFLSEKGNKKALPPE